MNAPDTGEGSALPEETTSGTPPWMSALKAPKGRPDHLLWQRPGYWPSPLTLGLSGPGLGDAWKSAQCALHLRHRLGVEASIYCLVHEQLPEERRGLCFGDPANCLPSESGPLQEAWQVEQRAYLERPVVRDRGATLWEILELLDVPGGIEVVSKVGAAPFVRAPIYPWSFPYFPTRLRWRPGPDGGGSEGVPTRAPHHGRIACQLESAAYPERSPAADDRARILEGAPGYEPVVLAGRPTLRACVEVLATSDLFVGIDAGMLHVCHSVGTPAFVLARHENPALLHADLVGTKAVLCADAEDMLAKVRSFLGLPT